MTKHIPNALTLVNLMCGCCGIVSCLHNQSEYVPMFMMIALLADFADGFVARALNVKSDIGAQLDSLADMVTFGVLPGTLLFCMIQYNLFNNLLNDSVNQISQNANSSDLVVRLNSFSYRAIPFLGFIYSLFACLRLAKFNIDDRQSENFIGMPTPAGGMFVLGLYMNFFVLNFLIAPVYSPVFLSIITILLALLMVCPLPMFSLKFNTFTFKGNEARYVFLLMCLPQPFIFKWLSLSTIIMTYVGWSLLLWIRERMKPIRN